MALSDEDKAEMKGIFAEAIVEGFKGWRSFLEEEAAKNPPPPTPPPAIDPTKVGDNDRRQRNKLAAFVLGDN